MWPGMGMEIKEDTKHYSRGSGFPNWQMVVPHSKANIMMKQCMEREGGKNFSCKHTKVRVLL